MADFPEHPPRPPILGGAPGSHAPNRPVPPPGGVGRNPVPPAPRPPGSAAPASNVQRVAPRPPAPPAPASAAPSPSLNALGNAPAAPRPTPAAPASAKPAPAAVTPKPAKPAAPVRTFSDSGIKVLAGLAALVSVLTVVYQALSYLEII